MINIPIINDKPEKVVEVKREGKSTIVWKHKHAIQNQYMVHCWPIVSDDGPIQDRCGFIRGMFTGMSIEMKNTNPVANS